MRNLSIVIPTIGRRQEVQDLLTTLCVALKYINYEILIIDQNTNGLIDEVVFNMSKKLHINHLKPNLKGLSKAKNYGASLATKEFISFPDDDCKIFENTYLKAFELLENGNLDMVFGKCVDENGNDSVLNFRKEAYFLNSFNIVGGFVEATVVAKKVIFEKFTFDENMGAGAFFGAEEGFDWLYRILRKGNSKAFYSPEIIFYHPQVISHRGDENSLKRVFSYRCGSGYLYKKHGFYGKFFKRLFISLSGSVFYFFVDKRSSAYYKTEFLALLKGYTSANFK